jgi:hypothetical protein
MRILAIRIRSGKVDIYALKRGEDCPTKNFLRQLKMCRSPDIGRLTHLLDETCENGVIENNEYRFKNLGDGLYEFKAAGGARLLCFQDNNGKRLVICANGVVKKRDKHDKPTLNEALKWRSDYFRAKADKTLDFIDEQ